VKVATRTRPGVALLAIVAGVISGVMTVVLGGVTLISLGLFGESHQIGSSPA
jgi:hypothetical protein